METLVVGLRKQTSPTPLLRSQLLIHVKVVVQPPLLSDVPFFQELSYLTPPLKIESATRWRRVLQILRIEKKRKSVPTILWVKERQSA